MVRSARRGSPRARPKQPGERRSGRTRQPAATALPRLTNYLDAVADALRAAGLTVLEMGAQAEPTGLHGEIKLALPSVDDGSRHEIHDPDAQHGLFQVATLAWRQRTGWRLQTARDPRGATPLLHPDREPAPEPLAAVVRALLAGRLLAGPSAISVTRC